MWTIWWMVGEELETKKENKGAAAEKMAIDGRCRDSGGWKGCWEYEKKFLKRSGSFTHPDFKPSTESHQFFLETCSTVLAIGTGDAQ